MIGYTEFANTLAVRKEYNEAVESGDHSLAERIARANPDLFPLKGE